MSSRLDAHAYVCASCRLGTHETLQGKRATHETLQGKRGIEVVGPASSRVSRLACISYANNGINQLQRCVPDREANRRRTAAGGRENLAST